MQLAPFILAGLLGQQEASPGRLVASTAEAPVHADRSAATLGEPVVPLRIAARRAVPDDVPDAEVDQAVCAGLWSPARNAVAVVLHRARGSLVFVFILQPSGELLAVDVSAVERANLGKLGSSPEGYGKVETAPVRWLDRVDGAFQVLFRTRAWKAGRRFAVTEPLLIQRDGTVVWR